MFSIVYNHLKIRLIVFLLTKNEPLTSLDRQSGSSFANYITFALPCLYSGPERTAGFKMEAEPLFY